MGKRRRRSRLQQLKTDVLGMVASARNLSVAAAQVGPSAAPSRMALSVSLDSSPTCTVGPAMAAWLGSGDTVSDRPTR